MSTPADRRQVRPIDDAVGPVQGMIRHDAAWKVRECPPDRCVVVMQLQARLSWAVDFGIVDLDLVGLGMSSGPGEESDNRGLS